MGKEYTSGSIREFSINGIPFQVMSDANFTEKPSEYENEAVATSGEHMIKKTRIAQVLESVTLGTSAADRNLLAGFADSTEHHRCSYINAAGDSYRNAAVAINIEGNETESNTTTLSIQPVEKWTVALA